MFFAFKSHSECIVAYVYGSANKQKQLWEFHLVMFHMQSTYLLKLTVRLRLLYSLFLFSLWTFVLGGHKTFLGVKTSIFIIFFSKKFSWQNKIWRSTKKFTGGLSPNTPRGYRPDSDFPDNSLNRHYLTKPSSSDKRGLTVDTAFSGP